MEIITKKELREMLLNARRGANIVSIISETVPRMRKTGNPYHGKIVKVSRINGMINWIYENAVNNQRKREDKEADFEASPRVWGERIDGTPLVKHKDNYYLELKVERSLNKKYVDDEGNVIDEEELEDFLYNSNSPKQRLDNEVILRDYRLDHIDSIQMNGEFYKVV